MIFGTLNPEKIWHEMPQTCPPHLSDIATLPWEIQKKSCSTVLFIHNSDYLCHLRRKQTVIHLLTPPENVTTLICELQNFFIWLKVCCILSNAGGSEDSKLWVVVSGSEKNQLWCVATGMSGMQCHSKCSEWPPSAWIMFPVFYGTDQSHSTPRRAEIQPMSQQAAATSLNMSISLHALLLLHAPDAVPELCR